MQAIWSRAAQSQVCRCKACLHAPNALTSRRSATAASQHRVTIAEALTTLSTAFMATAAVVDAKHKDDRRRDLDRRIDEAREGLARLEDETGHVRERGWAGLSSHTAQRNILSSSATGILKSICSSPVELIRHRQYAKNRRLEMEALHGHFEVDEMDCTPFLGRPRRAPDYSSIAWAIENPDEAVEASQRDPQNAIQLSSLNSMIVSLVKNLLLWADQSSSKRNSPTHTVSERYGAACYSLMEEGFPDYEYPYFDATQTSEARRQLNAANQRIFSSWERDNVPCMVEKLCHNLLVSSAPPGINCYNLLLLGFTQVGEHNLAAVVVRSFLARSRFRPTPETLELLLHHYREKGDIVGFHRMIHLLNGDGRGVKIRRKSLAEVRRRRSLWEWACSADVSVHHHQIVERAERRGPLLEAMIWGLVHFWQLPDAAKVFMLCMRDGHSISHDILCQLLDRCAASCDLTSAWMIIQSLLVDLDRTVATVAGCTGPTRISEKIAKLFDICGVSPWAGSGQELLMRSHHVSIEKLRHLAVSVLIEETNQDLARCQTLCQNVVKSLKLGNALVDRAQRALTLMSSAEKSLEIRLRDRRNFRTMARTHMITKQSRFLDESIDKIWAGVLELVENSPLGERLRRDGKYAAFFGLLEGYQERIEVHMVREPGYIALRNSKHLVFQAKMQLLACLPENERSRLFATYSTTEGIDMDAILAAHIGYRMEQSMVMPSFEPVPPTQAWPECAPRPQIDTNHDGVSVADLYLRQLGVTAA